MRLFGKKKKAKRGRPKKVAVEEAVEEIVEGVATVEEYKQADLNCISCDSPRVEVLGLGRSGQDYKCLDCHHGFTIQ